MTAQTFNEGDRVYSYDFDGSKVYGTIHKNTDNSEVSEWYIKYDDGKELAVLDLTTVFKASARWALQQIAQMSDCGSAELTIIRMKEIAANALKNQQ